MGKVICINCSSQEFKIQVRERQIDNLNILLGQIKSAMFSIISAKQDARIVAEAVVDAIDKQVVM